VRVDRFIRAVNEAPKDPNPYWNADSEVWSWNAWVGVDPAMGVTDRVSRLGPVVVRNPGAKHGDLVAFRVHHVVDGVWVLKWSPEKDVVKKMWILPG
jgi:hypothetical protein